MKRLAIIAVLLLSGCEEFPSSTDQCLRRELFAECLRLAPAGPTSTRYNDWDEIIASCDSYASWASSRRKTHIKPECRP